MNKKFFDNKLGEIANITYKDTKGNSFVVGKIRAISWQGVELETRKGRVMIAYDSMVAVQIKGNNHERK